MTAASDMFVTETMAELSARQGRVGDAIAIYRRLLDGASPGDERRAKWASRLSTLEEGAPPANDAGAERPPATDTESPPTIVAAPAPAEPVLRPALVVREPVRSGQIVYAQHTDLIVLAPVNPGAQLLADGNIHIYATLRGRAVAGVRGAVDAQIFCHRLEAELVGIDAAYRLSDDIPAALYGRAVRVWLDGGHILLEPLPADVTPVTGR